MATNVPREIIERYRNGERRIVVSKDTFDAYASTLCTLIRDTDGPIPSERWLAYKTARIVLLND